MGPVDGFRCTPSPSLLGNVGEPGLIPTDDEEEDLPTFYCVGTRTKSCTGIIKGSNSVICESHLVNFGRVGYSHAQCAGFRSYQDAERDSNPWFCPLCKPAP